MENVIVVERRIYTTIMDHGIATRAHTVWMNCINVLPVEKNSMRAMWEMYVTRDVMKTFPIIVSIVVRQLLAMEDIQYINQTT